MLKKDAICAIIFSLFSLCYVKKKAVIKTLYNLTKIFNIELNQYIDSIRLGNNKRKETHRIKVFFFIELIERAFSFTAHWMFLKFIYW